MATIGLLIPTVYHIAANQRSGGWSPAAEQRLTLDNRRDSVRRLHPVAGFSPVTHKDLFAGEAHTGDDDSEGEAAGMGAARRPSSC